MIDSLFQLLAIFVRSIAEISLAAGKPIAQVLNTISGGYFPLNPFYGTVVLLLIMGVVVYKKMENRMWKVIILVIIAFVLLSVLGKINIETLLTAEKNLSTVLGNVSGG